MRPFALTILSAIAVLNCFLAYSGRAFAALHYSALQGFGGMLPSLTKAAFALPPWFYVVAAASAILATLGVLRKVTENQLVYAAVGLLIVDIGGLLVLGWGFVIPYLRMSHG